MTTTCPRCCSKGIHLVQVPQYGCSGCGWIGTISDLDPTHVVEDRAALLRLSGQPSLTDLSDRIDEDLECDAKLEVMPDDEGVELIVHDRGVYLTYPFLLEELWAYGESLSEEVGASDPMED